LPPRREIRRSSLKLGDDIYVALTVQRQA